MDSTLVNFSSTFSEINELIGHLIWPILILILIFMFKDKISALFSSLRKLRFSDIEAEFDEREKSFAEQEVSPLNDEIDGLVKRIEKALSLQLLAILGPLWSNLPALSMPRLRSQTP